MIDGNEPINAIVETNSIEGHEFLDCNHTGITLKQHMVIEFTKALITALYSNQTMFNKVTEGLNIAKVEFDEGIAKMAVEHADATIKQLNEE